jgi:hypothetical protein
MTPQHTRSGKPPSVRAACCVYHQNGPDLAATIAHTYFAGAMMIVATAGSTIIFILSAAALQGIYGWYPQFVAQQWFMYDQLLTIFSFLGLMFGALATALMLSRRNYRGAVASATACTLSGASTLVVSLIQPLALWWQSLLYYFLPLFIAPLAGTLLTYLQEEKTEHSSTA